MVRISEKEFLYKRSFFFIIFLCFFFNYFSFNCAPFAWMLDVGWKSRMKKKRGERGMK